MILRKENKSNSDKSHFKKLVSYFLYISIFEIYFDIAIFFFCFVLEINFVAIIKASVFNWFLVL